MTTASVYEFEDFGTKRTGGFFVYDSTLGQLSVSGSLSDSLPSAPLPLHAAKPALDEDDLEDDDEVEDEEDDDEFEDDDDLEDEDEDDEEFEDDEEEDDEDEDDDDEDDDDDLEDDDPKPLRVKSRG